MSHSLWLQHQIHRLSRISLKAFIVIVVLLSVAVVGGVFYRDVIIAFFTPSLTVWIGPVSMHSDIVLDGNKTLIIDGATIHNPGTYTIIVKDSANLTMINGVTKHAAPIHGEASSEIRVSCCDNSTVTISDSSVDRLTFSDSGTLTIKAGSNVSLIRISTSSTTRPRVIDSSIELVEGPLKALGNFSVVGETFSGSYDNRIGVSGSSTITYQVYSLRISGSNVVRFNHPAVLISSCHIAETAQLFLNNLTYPLWMWTHGNNGAIIRAYDEAHVSISNSMLGIFSSLILCNNAPAEASPSPRDHNVRPAGYLNLIRNLSNLSCR